MKIKEVRHNQSALSLTGQKAIIFIPFAHSEMMRSSANVRLEPSARLNMYLSNVCAGLVSAKRHNPECTVALVTNIPLQDIPDQFTRVLNCESVKMIYAPFDRFRFDDDYPWSLAFYKLCALSYIVELGYDLYAYLDADVFVQGSFQPIWEECGHHILMYDIDLGLNEQIYRAFLEETCHFLGESRIITQFGGEFFASRHGDAVDFLKNALDVYSKMIRESFVTTKGDEFITSLVADKMGSRVRNAGAYIFRFWTGAYRLVSTSYQFNRVIILHLPAEKERGLMAVYNQYISKGKMPSDKEAWRIFRLSRSSMIDRIKRLIKNTRLFKQG